MMEYNKDDLAFYQGQVARKNKLNAMIRERNEQRRRLRANKEELAKILNKEKKDVERLEKISPVSLFYSVIGKKDEKLNKEKQEEIVAAFKYNLAKEELNNLEMEICSLNTEVHSLRDAEKLCKKAFEIKVQYIKDNNLSCANELVALESKMLFFQNEQKEIKEAIDAGKNVLTEAKKVQGCLKEADSWATLDTVGIFDNWSWYQKRENLEAAEMYIKYLHKALAKFKTELKDINMNFEYQSVTNDLTGWADLIFDGLIFDLFSGSKIVKTSKQVKKICDQVIDLINELKNNHIELSNENQRLQSEYERIIYSI